MSALFPRRLTVVAVGKVKDRHWRALADEYAARAGHYWRLDVVEVRDAVGGGLPDAQAVVREGEALLKAVPAGARVVVLSERGRTVDSEGLAGELSCWLGDEAHDVALLIGGPVGFSEAVWAAADDRLALSALTFTHEMARVVLLEQVYRAGTILAGTGYHK